MCHYVLQETANKISRTPTKKINLMKNFSENKASWHPREDFSAGFNQVYCVSTQLMHLGLPLILLRTSALGFGSVSIINTKGRFCNTFCEEVDKKITATRLTDKEQFGIRDGSDAPRPSHCVYFTGRHRLVCLWGPRLWFDRKVENSHESLWFYWKCFRKKSSFLKMWKYFYTLARNSNLKFLMTRGEVRTHTFCILSTPFPLNCLSYPHKYWNEGIYPFC